MRQFIEIHRDFESLTDLQKKAANLREMCTIRGTITNVFGYTNSLMLAVKEETSRELVFCVFDKSYERMFLGFSKGQTVTTNGIIYWEGIGGYHMDRSSIVTERPTMDARSIASRLIGGK